MAVPFDINKADFLSTLEACHSRLIAIQKEDEKRHEMDVDIAPHWQSYLEEVLMPAIEDVIHDEPSDTQMKAAFGTPWHDGL